MSLEHHQMKVMMNTCWFKPILNPMITKFKYFEICKFFLKKKKKLKLKFWVHLSFEMVFDVRIMLTRLKELF